MWAFLSKNRDAGLLFLRVTLGGFFFWAHGWPKLAGGIALWSDVGDAMRHVGVHYWPALWGFLATMAESVGIVLIMIGAAFRPACLILAMTMVVAAVDAYFTAPRGITPLIAASHAIEVGIVFLSLIFIGPGKYSVDRQ